MNRRPKGTCWASNQKKYDRLMIILCLVVALFANMGECQNIRTSQFIDEESLTQCIESLYRVDADGDNELDQDEYVEFLQLFEEQSPFSVDPSAIASFLDLTLDFVSIYLWAACWCEVTGGGASDCCLNGKDHIELDPSASDDLEFYITFVCMQVEGAFERAEANLLAPSAVPSIPPSESPSHRPSNVPSDQPSEKPSGQPSDRPSYRPSNQPSNLPSYVPSNIPSKPPSESPSRVPSVIPSAPPTLSSSAPPSVLPSFLPSDAPSIQPSMLPSDDPSNMPSALPSDLPSALPSNMPSNRPSLLPSNLPSDNPSNVPSLLPSYTPSLFPSGLPSFVPSISPSGVISNLPSDVPSTVPSMQPSYSISDQPSDVPSNAPTGIDSAFPSALPSDLPSFVPSDFPSGIPSDFPSLQPSDLPSNLPSDFPSYLPSTFPSGLPSDMPSVLPSDLPSTSPSELPSDQPSFLPSDLPSFSPSALPSDLPSTLPSDSPSAMPSAVPSELPSDVPSTMPSSLPSHFPSIATSAFPSAVPSLFPSYQPSMFPSLVASVSPTSSPSETPLQVICVNFQYRLSNNIGLRAQDIMNEVNNTLLTGLLIATRNITIEIMNTTIESSPEIEGRRVMRNRREQEDISFPYSNNVFSMSSLQQPGTYVDGYTGVEYLMLSAANEILVKNNNHMVNNGKGNGRRAEKAASTTTATYSSIQNVPPKTIGTDFFLELIYGNNTHNYPRDDMTNPYYHHPEGDDVSYSNQNNNPMLRSRHNKRRGRRKLAYYSDEFPVQVISITDIPFCQSNNPDQVCAFVSSSACLVLESDDDEDLVRTQLTTGLRVAVNTNQILLRVPPEYIPQ